MASQKARRVSPRRAAPKTSSSLKAPNSGKAAKVVVAAKAAKSVSARSTGAKLQAAKKGKSPSGTKPGKAVASKSTAKAARPTPSASGRLTKIKEALFGKGKAAATAAPASSAKSGAKAATPAGAKAVPAHANGHAGNMKNASASKKTPAAAAPALAPAKAPATPAPRGRGKASKVPFSDVTAAVTAAKAAKQGGRIAAPSMNSENICREVACEGLATTGGYCRLHYIKNWKKIKRKEVILQEGKLTRYINELVGKYPDKYIEAIRQDLASDKDFAKVIYDLDLDEGADDAEVEGDSAEAEIGVRGGRDFEDDSDAF